MSKMNFLDRTVAFLNPSAGVERAIARERLKMFGYDAAQPGTRRGRSGGMAKNAGSESWRSQRDRVALMWDARDMVRNFGILRGMVARVVQYVADRVQYVSQTGDEEIDSIYQDYFHSWCERADVTGRHRLGNLFWLMVWGYFVDGDHGWNLIEVEEHGERDLRVQAVESDRIGNPNEATKVKQGYVGGIELDEVGKPVGYHVFKRDMVTNQYSLDQVVPAEQFLHVFDPSRVDQYRGITALATCLATARDLYEIYQFEKLAAKWQVGHAGIAKVADPTRDRGASAWNDTTTTKSGNTAGTYAMEAGKILRVEPGEEVIFAPGTNRPGPAFMNLNEVMVREMVMGFNMPYGFLYNMSALGGHTGRVEVAQAERSIRRHQKLASELALNPVRDAVLGRAIGLKLLPPHPRWREGVWRFGPSLTGDYGHDTNANLQRLQMGLVTASDLIAETGQSYEEVTRRQASEVKFAQKVASEMGVPIELLHGRMPTATAALANINTPPPPPPKGLLEEGKDVKPLLEILEQVGEGLLDRESAIQSIVNIYGIPRGRAEKMVPKQGKPEEDKY
jgi:capsid protein